VKEVQVGKDGTASPANEGTGMAWVPRGREQLRDDPIAVLLRSLLADVRLIVDREAELAKLELKNKGSQLGIVGGLLSGAAVVAAFGLGTLIAAAVLALAIVLPAWAAALIVGLLLVVVAAVLFLVGRARTRSIGSLMPTETIETAREDVAWIRREAERLGTTT
jgi:hypothetical protein